MMSSSQPAPLEGKPMEDQLINCITPKDVLCGRGSRVNRHAGNVHYRKLMGGLQDQYATATKAQKRRLAVQVVTLIRSENGRFLQHVEVDNVSGWIEIDLERATKKTIQAMRETLEKAKRSDKRRQRAIIRRTSLTDANLTKSDGDVSYGGDRRTSVSSASSCDSVENIQTVVFQQLKQWHENSKGSSWLALDTGKTKEKDGKTIQFVPNPLEGEEHISPAEMDELLEIEPDAP